MGTAFKELDGSPVEYYSSDGIRAEREILVDWDDRAAMLRELMGDGYEFGGGTKAVYPNMETVVVATVRVKRFPSGPDEQGAFTDITSDLNSYTGKFARMSVTYELLASDGGREDLPTPEPDTWLTYAMDIGGKYQMRDDRHLLWDTDATQPIPPDVAGTMLIPESEHILTWHNVSTPPWTTIRECRGTVNDAAFCGAPVGTVLFEGCKATREFTSQKQAIDEMQFNWRLQYTFLERAVPIQNDAGAVVNWAGWNHFWRSLPKDAPGWDQLKDQDGNDPYVSSTLDDLFKYEPAA